MRLVILGGSGAGKSTQAQRIGEHFHIPLISTGAILREEIASHSELGCNIQSYLQTGDLAPDEIMIECIRQRLIQPNIKDGWVLEGYPRTAFQAEELDFLLDDCQQKLDWAIYLQVPEAVMVNRSLGRSLEDDQLEIVQRRIELFYDRTIPILEYYDRRRRLLTINGDRTPEAVLQQIVNFLCVARDVK
ncbi:MAG: nucleoside monophosphate kinase [Calothrix sp. MO_167.B12]|nr:nucleoside monophosphate kinase [Calothrix sp. MO_167.B12]